jgi:hypothetical protein
MTLERRGSMKDLWKAFKELHKYVQIAIVIAVLVLLIIAAFNHSALENMESLILLGLTIVGFKSSNSSQK